MRFIFHALKSLAPKARSGHLQMLAEAYQACQAEQGRVVDYLFGVLSGRDKGLREQLLALVDAQKQRTLDIVTTTMNPKSSASESHSPHSTLTPPVLTLTLQPGTGARMPSSPTSKVGIALTLLTSLVCAAKLQASWT